MCVHTRHCCREHGCKYGESDCPVYLCYVIQESICQSCFDAHIDQLTQVRKPKIKEIQERRNRSLYESEF